MTTTGPTCLSIQFNPDDRVIYAGFVHGKFLRYSNDFRCLRDRMYHPAHRIAVFQPDPTPHQQSGDLIGWGEWRTWSAI